ncbi:YD repeat protein, partial [Catenovulum agarivorans DS-2]
DLNGQLMSTSVYERADFWAGGEPLHHEEYDYTLVWDDVSYLSSITEPRTMFKYDGFNVTWYPFLQTAASRVIRTETTITTNQQDEYGNAGLKNKFYSSVAETDLLGNPMETLESNDATGMIKQTIKNYEYISGPYLWLVSLPSRTLIRDDLSKPLEAISSTVYHSDIDGNPAYDLKGLVYEQKKFGVWQSRNTEYHSDGRLKKVLFNKLASDGSSYLFEKYENYKLGTAQSISKYDVNSTNIIGASKVVDAFGQIKQITDFNGNRVNYGYDNAGRQLYVDYLDSFWEDTLTSYIDSSNGTTITQQKCKLSSDKTYCATSPKLTIETTQDTLGNTLLNQLTDETGLLDPIYTVYDYDKFGRITFESYPSFNEFEQNGLHLDYDELSRVKSISENRKAGLEAVTIEYLNNNRKKTTDAKNNQTIVQYQAYGRPSYAAAVNIRAPEDVNTDIAVNVFGDVL